MCAWRVCCACSMVSIQTDRVNVPSHVDPLISLCHHTFPPCTSNLYRQRLEDAELFDIDKLLECRGMDLMKKLVAPLKAGGIAMTHEHATAFCDSLNDVNLLGSFSRVRMSTYASDQLTTEPLAGASSVNAARFLGGLADPASDIIQSAGEAVNASVSAFTAPLVAAGQNVISTWNTLVGQRI